MIGGAHAAEMTALLGDCDRALALIASARTGNESMGPATAPLTWAEGIAALQAEDLETAEGRARDALTATVAWGSEVYMLESLQLLGWAMSGRGASASAARLLGAAESCRRARRWALTATAASREDRMRRTLRASLGDEALQDLWVEGGAMTLNEAVAYASRGRGRRERPSFGWDSLTPTELTVVELVAEGLPNAQIATRLFITPATVKSHLTHVYTKLGLNSRVELARDYSARR